MRFPSMATLWAIPLVFEGVGNSISNPFFHLNVAGATSFLLHFLPMSAIKPVKSSAQTIISSQISMHIAQNKIIRTGDRNSDDK